MIPLLNTHRCDITQSLLDYAQNEHSWDPDENFTDEERQKVENKAKELMDKAKEEFDDFIESMGFENGMGMLFRKDKQ